MKDRRIGERRTEKYTHWPSWYRERRKTIIKAGHRANTKDRRGSCRCDGCLCWEVKNMREKEK